jgi:hypothetical protein
MNKHKSLETEVSEDHRIQAKGSVVCKQLLQDDKEPCLLLYIKERKRRFIDQLSEPLSSKKGHFAETCCCILEVDYWDNVEQIGSETVEEGKGSLRRPSRQLDASCRSWGLTWRPIEGNPLGSAR